MRPSASFRLARRAPERHALIVTLVRPTYGRSASAAGSAGPSVHVKLLAASQRAGRGLRPPAAVRGHHPLRARHDTEQVGYVTDRTPRPDPTEEQHLGLVHVADAGE